ncbi:hypothetical protein [Pedobacter duraquae]|uniref:Uncharacterized protein n=1 Tax=Pedobacter duraquae TaxID=425511 RepID=A0A4R6IP43_9SPHI|nr:hypothetical protein [Pedobacter duraquae]TDO23766.1 hypothetical protein CLV32_0051 [Pedobacter duraquae]
MKSVYVDECIRASIEALELAKLIRELNSSNYEDAVKFLRLYTRENRREDIVEFTEKIILDIEKKFQEVKS